ncbi:unnamed protein product [Anisakis simplex]|uniref:Uncharacterized protein n=1 Tax=Anisakis simplex TaxID=6269 RepID=A0A0M3J1T1_ANISI|nr:unnamed protein product [Anisakis simplex]
MYRDDGPTGGGIPPVKRPMQQCESQCAPSEVASVSSPVTYQQLKRGMSLIFLDSAYLCYVEQIASNTDVINLSSI